MAIEFEKSSVFSVSGQIKTMNESFFLGKQLCEDLPKEGLTHVLVFSDGHLINGSDLVRGIDSVLPSKVSLTGGLAGDADRFSQTLVGLNQDAQPGVVVLVGLYGNNLVIGHGSKGGWDSFGPEREITRSEGNVLYELDNQSALELYKRYLGPQAEQLPGSALLFPLSIRYEKDGIAVVRTILSVDENKQSMTFAGDMPTGATAQLMKANFDRLIDGASLAAENGLRPFNETEPELALLISCVGRKLILAQRIDEEVEAVAETLKGEPVLTGFYSYGEIAPFYGAIKCELHNQTMTITTFSER